MLMYKNELDVIEQHNWTEGSKYIQLIKMNMKESRDEDECRKLLVDVYQLMKPKEFKSKWNRFQRIAPKVEWITE